MSNENRDGESPKAWADAAVVSPRRHQLRVDLSERNAAVLRLARECEDFDVQMVHLPIGDYFIDSGVVVERKTYADFAISLVDGRLFPQAAALAQSPHRPVVLLEGPKPLRMPDVHPHALKGAIVSLAVMWRLPVLHPGEPEDALRILRFLAQQVGRLGATRSSTVRPQAKAHRFAETLHASGPVRCGPSAGSTAVDQVWLGRTRCDSRPGKLDSG